MKEHKGCGPDPAESAMSLMTLLAAQLVSPQHVQAALEKMDDDVSELVDERDSQGERSRTG